MAPESHSRKESKRSLVGVIGVVVLFAIALATFLNWGWPSLFRPAIVEIMLPSEELKKDRGPYLKFESSVSQDAILFQDMPEGGLSWSSSRGRYGPAWHDSTLARIPKGNKWHLNIKPDVIYRIPVNRSRW